MRTAFNNEKPAPYSPLRAEVALDPLMREAMSSVMALGASPIQASWTMIGWTLDHLLAHGADARLLAADLRQVAADLETQDRQAA
jgi:hypothetical protein